MSVTLISLYALAGLMFGVAVRIWVDKTGAKVMERRRKAGLTHFIKV